MDTDTFTITTPRPPVLRPACSPTLLVVFLPLATSPSVPRSMSTTECSLLTLVTHTEGSSSILTSCLVLVLATSPPNLIQPKTKTKRTMDYPSHSYQYSLFIFYLFSSPCPPQLLLAGTANNILFLPVAR